MLGSVSSELIPLKFSLSSEFRWRSRWRYRHTMGNHHTKTAITNPVNVNRRCISISISQIKRGPIVSCDRELDVWKANLLINLKRPFYYSTTVPKIIFIGLSGSLCDLVLQEKSSLVKLLSLQRNHFSIKR